MFCNHYLHSIPLNMTFQPSLQVFTMHILLYNWIKIDVLFKQCTISIFSFLNYLGSKWVWTTHYCNYFLSRLLQHHCRITELPVSKSHNQSIIQKFNKIDQFVGPNKNAKWIKHLRIPIQYLYWWWNFSAIIYHVELELKS